MVTFDTQVLEIIKRTHDVISLRFGCKENFEFKAGQFFFITIKINDQEKSKHFSFSNSPTESGYIEFTKRLTGSEFSNALSNLKIGDWARIKMPLGNFTLDKSLSENLDIVYLSGGIGITPIRSMCKFIFDKKIPINVTLFYGNNTEEDIVFKEDFDEIKKRDNFNIIYTLTSKNVDKNKWAGRLGYIDKDMIEQEVIDYKNKIFYICGPPNMVKALTDILKSQLYIKEEHIKLENFTGY